MSVKNANQKPRIYYGLHFCPGVAEYREPGKEPVRIFLNEQTIREMSPSFAGCPLYVRHVEDVDLKNIQAEADGYVVESFFNTNDGKTWAKFVVVSDKGHQAVQNKWKLSNAYVPKGYGPGGLWNGVQYQKQVTSAEFEHLALVPNPRYEESIILTPEEFRTYNDERQFELKKVANSKGDPQVLKFFKRQQVENMDKDTDLAEVMVTLPKSKKEMPLSQVINDADAYAGMKADGGGPAGMADMSHKVKIGDNEMSVGDLVNHHMKMNDCMNKMRDAMGSIARSEVQDPGEKKGEKDKDKGDKTQDMKKNDELQDPGEKKEEIDHKKADPEEKDRLKNAEKEKVKNAEEEKTRFEALQNAHLSNQEVSKTVETVERTERGKSRYGSGK